MVGVRALPFGRSVPRFAGRMGNRMFGLAVRPTRRNHPRLGVFVTLRHAVHSLRRFCFGVVIVGAIHELPLPDSVDRGETPPVSQLSGWSASSFQRRGLSAMYSAMRT